MLDTNPPTVTMADDNLPRQTWSTRDESGRKWTCPSDQAIASYMDGALGEKQKFRVEAHLSKCSRCRQILGGTIRAEREIELATPPLAVFNKSILAAPTNSASRSWFWLPAGATAIIVLVASATIFLGHREQGLVSSPPSPSAPLVAKSTAGQNPQSVVADVVRNLPTTTKTSIRITFPQPGRVYGKEPLQVEWTGVPEARSYEVSVVASDGDLIWKGETRKRFLAMPSELSLENGSYFVWVTSYLPGGRTAKTAPISFVVKR